MVERSNPTFSPEHRRFLEYIRAVGTGPKGNRPLGYEEMKDAFNLILSRQIPDPLISAFLLGWRVQGESDEELQACVDTLAQAATWEKSGVEIGYPMDGKAKFFPLMLKAAALLPDLNIHAAYDLPLGPKYGFQTHQFEPFSPNVLLHNRADLFPQLSQLSELRNSIGIRSAFSTLEKLNFLSPIALIGMHHAPYFELYASLYAPHYTRLIIVQGHEGTPEILKKTKYKVLEKGEITTHHIDPEEFGIEPISAKEEMSLGMMKTLMEHPDENLAKMIRLNAAFLGWCAGNYETIEKGMMCLQD